MPQQDHHIVIALNGHYDHPRHLCTIVDTADTLIACDGGANWLLSQGYMPHYLIGDMDSVDAHILLAAESAGCTIERYPVAKDETDGELGIIKAAALGASRITLIGALGGRIDHELANIMLLAMSVITNIPTTIDDAVSRIQLATAGHAQLHGAPGDTVSLIPWGGEVDGITTTNLEYPLNHEPLLIGPARGISNVMLADSATVSVRTGSLLIVHTPSASTSNG